MISADLLAEYEKLKTEANELMPYGYKECLGCERWVTNDTAESEKWVAEIPTTCGCTRPGSLCLKCLAQHDKWWWGYDECDEPIWLGRCDSCSR